MRKHLSGYPESPLLLYVGRLSAEKRIERIKPVLDAIQSSLALVGDGPHRTALEKNTAGTPTHFVGYLTGKEWVLLLPQLMRLSFPRGRRHWD